MKELLDLIYTRKILLQQEIERLSWDRDMEDSKEWYKAEWFEMWRKEELIKTTRLLDEIIEKIIK